MVLTIEDKKRLIRKGVDIVKVVNKMVDSSHVSFVVRDIESLHF